MKTCLISQLNYVGCFLPAPAEILNSIQRLINSFVKKNLPVAADRLYLPAELGGLGIFNISSFLKAQHCSWVLRAHRSPIDNWRFDLRAAAPEHNITLIKSCDLSPEFNPILHGMALSFEYFYGEFSKLNGNYKNAYIFRNPAICRGGDTDLMLDINFFGEDFYHAHKPRIRKLTFSDCFVGDRVKTVAELAQDGLPLQPACWLRLQAALHLARNRLRKNDESEQATENLDTFLSRVKKGSKKFRLILDACAFRNADPTNLRTVQTFAELTNTLPPPKMALIKCIGIWKFSWLKNDMRNFLYLLRNNGLMLNNRLNAIDNTVSPFCTFCKIIDRETNTRDSFSHFFRDCAVTRRLLTVWCTKFEPPIDGNSPEFDQLYWYGTAPAGVEDNVMLNTLIVDSTKYVLWKFKNRRTIPNSIVFLNEIGAVLTNIRWLSPKIDNKLVGYNFVANFLQALG